MRQALHSWRSGRRLRGCCTANGRLGSRRRCDSAPAWQAEHDQAIPERDAALRQLEKWQQDMTEFTWALRMVLDRQYPGSWPAVMTEVRKHRPLFSND